MVNNSNEQPAESTESKSERGKVQGVENIKTATGADDHKAFIEVQRRTTQN